jgi:hemerythrin-like domain-containing protein
MHPQRFDDRSIAGRRSFLQRSAAGATVFLAACASSGRREPEPDSEGSSGEAEVTPGEDLMQEHGVVERVLLVYGEVARRIDQGAAFDRSVVTDAARIVRRFVEDYHERNEEQFVFPRLESAGREVKTVTTLRRQHQRGRELTDEIVRRVEPGASPELARLLRAFERMYRPHAAREDTVVIPAFRSLMGREAYAELGEELEEREHELLGEHGFEAAVAEVARLEGALGISELDSFTA